MATRTKKQTQVKVDCPECGEELDLLDLFSPKMQVVGEQANCDFCGVVLEIVSIDPVVLGGVDDGDEDEDEEDDTDLDDDEDDDDYEDDEDDEE
jgi:lysine biosynthesis protein LysW